MFVVLGRGWLVPELWAPPHPGLCPLLKPGRELLLDCRDRQGWAGLDWAQGSRGDMQAGATSGIMGWRLGEAARAGAAPGLLTRQAGMWGEVSHPAPRVALVPGAAGWLSG